MDAQPTDQTGSSLMSESDLKTLSRNARQFAMKSVASDPQTKLLLDTLQDVLIVASAVNITATHRVAAWNALCALVDACASSRERDQRLLWHENVWSRAFELYLSKAHLARPKSARQLLVTLSTSLKASGPHDDRSMRVETAHHLLRPLLRQDEAAKAKNSSLALVHFLSKDILDMEQLLECFTLLLNKRGGVAGLSALESLLCTLFEWAILEDFGSTIAQLVIAVIDRSSHLLHDGPTQQAHMAALPPWSSALRHACEMTEGHIWRLRGHVLPLLCKRSFADYIQFLEALGIRALVNPPRPTSASHSAPSESSLELLYAALQAGKDIGVIYEADTFTMEIADNVLILPVRSIRRLLVQESRSARLTGLILLINSHSSTRPMLRSALSAIMKSLPPCLADTDADFRGEFFGLIQRLIDRLRAILAVLARHVQIGKNKAENNVPSEDTTSTIISYHQDFLFWLCRILVWELRPTAGYQVHISALRLLDILARSGLDKQVEACKLAKSAVGETKWSLHWCVLTSKLRAMLLDLVVDPFDDVRQAAASILALYPISDDSCTKDLNVALHAAQHEMLITGRADKADGVAHLYALTYSRTARQDEMLDSIVEHLEGMLVIARKSLSQAVSDRPVHGLLAGIRLIVQRAEVSVLLVENRLRRLIMVLESVWLTVGVTLCNDAPEGYIPEDADDGEEASTKDALSYCWRALKESSLLLGAVVQKLMAAQLDEVQRLMELCFTQLAELRHRGAFSTVAQTWVLCCCKSTAIHVAALKEEPLSLWYERVIRMIASTTTINTRRSAGLPSLLCGILIADGSKDLMKRAISDLDSISRHPLQPNMAHNGYLPQVHAMNCIKDILKNGRLGEASAQYVPVALSLAADALGSQAWALRNCGLMLFRAVIDRLLGTSDAYLDDDLVMIKRLAIDQYPQLVPLVLRLLAGSVAVENGAHAAMERQEQVFPALQLLQRLAIPSDRRSEILRLVRRLTACPVWHVRDKAARVHAALLPLKGAMETTQDLLQTPTTSQNELHGALLSVRYLVRHVLKQDHCETSKANSTTDEQGFIPSMALDIVKRAETLYLNDSCPATKAACVDLYYDCFDALGGIEHTEEEEIVGEPRTPEDGGPHQVAFGLNMLIEELTTNMLAGGMAATLRLSLARALAMCTFHERQLTHNILQRLRSTVLILALTDRDACVAFLANSAARVRKGPWLRDTILEVFCCLAKEIYQQIDLDVGLRCEAQQLALAVLGLILKLGRRHPAFTELITDALHDSSILDAHTNQQYQNLHLQLRAAGLEYLASTHALTDHDPALRHFQEDCTRGLNGSGLYSREAIALAVSRLQCFWQSLKTDESLTGTFRELALVVYDLLNDDDEGLRILISRVSAFIAPRYQFSMGDDCNIPLVASQRLLAFMCKRWVSDSDFVEVAALRAFDILVNRDQSFSSRFERSSQGSTALFVEEKQNLYLDETREVKIWTQVIMRLKPSAFSRSLIKRLSASVTEGLGELIQQSSALTRGPLSWSTKPEMFVLGLQVLYGAEFLFHLVQRGVKIFARASDLRRQLIQLITIGSDGRLNPLWLREIHRIAALAVAQKLESVGRLLRTLLPKDDVAA